MKKTIKPIKYALYALALIIGVFIIVISTRVGRFNESIFNVNFFIVLSDSMRPQFQANDLIITFRTSIDSIQAGDIITYYSRDAASFGEIITHQVIEIISGGEQILFQTKGLNNATADPYQVAGADIIGVYQFHIPGAANILYFSRTTLGYVTLILLPFSVLAGLEFFDVKKKVDQSRALELIEIYKLMNIDKDSEQAKKLAKSKMSLEDVKKLVEINNLKN
jgi:signal peptidase